MHHSFNTAGPCVPGDHYMLDPLARLDVDEVLRLIDDKRYVVLHAPRQTGKTTSLMALMNRLNEEGRYRALYVNIESAQAQRGDMDRAMEVICQYIADACRLRLGDARLKAWLVGEGHPVGAGGRLQQLLRHGSE